jgi:Viral BACON domain
MKLKNITVMLLALTAITTVSCIKDPFGENGGKYLKFRNATANVANKQGATVTVTVESNINWQLEIERPVPDWITVSKLSGSNTGSLIVTATKDNNTGGYKFANIIATPANNIALPPVRLTVVQYDSLYKSK